MRNNTDDKDILDVQEPLSREAQTDPSLGWLLELHGFEYNERGVWLSVGHTTSAYGWKLHLSSIQIQSETLLQKVLQILAQWNLTFKIASS